MNADNSMVMESGGSQKTGDSHSPVGDVEKQQDSVKAGVGQPLSPPKVKCPKCYKYFARLDKHMIVHSNEEISKPFECPHCSKRFLTSSALTGHVKTHAEEGTFFACPMCSYSTTQWSGMMGMKEHVEFHRNEENGLFSCPKCPKKFSEYSLIRKHIRVFHRSTQFTCNQCPMSFPYLDKLKLHQLKHSDHREFQCTLCDKQFKRKDKFREHMKRNHENEEKTMGEIIIPDSQKHIPKIAPEDYQKFPFKCQDCLLGFHRRGMLVNHMAKKHPEKNIKSIPELNQPIMRVTRNYPCPYCEQGYHSTSKRKSHVLKAHPGRPLPPSLRGTGSASTVNLNGIVQTVTENGDGDRRSTSTSAEVRKEPSVVRKVATSPQACQWCYKEYATRAKLLQHQRKAHDEYPQVRRNNKVKKRDISPEDSEETSESSEDESVDEEEDIVRGRKSTRARSYLTRQTKEH